MVVIPFPGQAEERRVAYRLFRSVGKSPRQAEGCQDTYRHIRLGPLPGGTNHGIMKKVARKEQLFSLIYPFYLQLLYLEVRIHTVDEDRHHEHFSSRIKCSKGVFHVGASCLMGDFKGSWSV